MSIDKLSQAKQADMAQDLRRSEDKNKAGGKSFDAVLKKKPQLNEKCDKPDKKREKGGARERGPVDEMLGRERIERDFIEQRAGRDGEGGQGGGEGEGSKDMSDLETKAMEQASFEGKADGKAKAGKKEAFDRLMGKKGKEADVAQAAEGKAEAGKAEAGKAEGGKAESAKAEGGAVAGKAEGAKAEGTKMEATRADHARDLEQARRMDRPGEAESAVLAQKDDREIMKEQIAANTLPGQAPPLFLMRQIEEPQAVAPTQPVIPPEIVDKIVQNARFGMNAEGAHEFQIDLKESVYEGLKMKIATKEGKVTVEFVAENPEIQAKFEAKAAEVAKQLSDRGLNVTDVNVTLADNRQDASQGESRGKRVVGGMGGARGGARGLGQAGERVDSGGKSGKDYTA